MKRPLPFHVDTVIIVQLLLKALVLQRAYFACGQPRDLGYLFHGQAETF